MTLAVSSSVRPKLRGLVVDDAVVMRRLISNVLESDREIEVVGTAANGRIALQKMPQVNPDFVTLDIEMPELDGLATLKMLRKDYPDLPVIMLSLATRRGAVVTLDALSAGASDYVTKPQDVTDLQDSIRILGMDLLPKVNALCRKAKPVATPVVQSAGPLIEESTPAFKRRGSGKIELLCIATSTGGPNALAEVFAALDRKVSVPVLIVQHMPPTFTKLLAERIDKAGGQVRCVEATDGQVLEPGRAYLAPGGLHLAVERGDEGFVARLLDTPPENSCRPAADVLFRSAAQVVGDGVLSIVLTGMGSDGLRGAEAVIRAGGCVIAQDQDTSVVWGMPGAVTNAKLAEKVLPIGEIAPEILRRVGKN